MPSGSNNNGKKNEGRGESDDEVGRGGRAGDKRGGRNGVGRSSPDADQIQRQNQAVINGLMREANTDISIVNGVLTKTCRKRVETESERDFREKKRLKVIKEEAKKQRQRPFYDRACKRGDEKFDEGKYRRTAYHCPLDAEGLSKETLTLMDSYKMRRNLDIETLREKKEAKEEFKKKQQVEQIAKIDKGGNDDGENIDESGAGSDANVAVGGGGGRGRGRRRSESMREDDTQRDAYEPGFNAREPSTSQNRGQHNQ